MAARGRIRYGTKIGNRFDISNDIEGLKDVDSNTNILTGFDIDTSSFAGDEGYFVKQAGSGAKSVLIRVQDLNTSNPKVRGFRTLNYSTYGMACHGDYVYIASKDSTVVKASSKSKNDTPKVYEVRDKEGGLSGCQAITHYTGNKFIVLANAENENKNGTLCFWTGSFDDSELVFDVSEKFYVKNTTGNKYIRDIYYHPSYGLFIATNKRGGTVSNMIMRVEIDREADSTYNKEALYNPDAEYEFGGIASRYPEFNVMGLSIGRDGTLYTAVKVTKESGQYTDAGVFLINNMKFASSGTIEINIDCNKGVKIETPNFIGSDGNPHGYINPGAFAMNGMKAYCLKTYTGSSLADKKNKASVLMSSSNVATEEFIRVGTNELTTMGHGNGMTYYEGALYVAAYNKDFKPEQRQIAKIGTDGYLKETFESDYILGSISYYGDGQFIAGDYETRDVKYSYEPIFYIGTLDDDRKKFIKNSQFCVENPVYDTSNPDSNLLQDIHYSPEHGLFYCVKTGDIERIYRVTPDQIEKADPAEPITPKEAYIPGASVGEVESFAIGSDGKMYFAENNDDKENNGIYDYAKQIQTLTFYEE